MSWLKIDDGFAEHEKVDPLSDAAHRLWMRCACWCSKNDNLVLDGFIPLDKVVKLAGGSVARAKRLAAELVDAKGPPQYGHEHGLWEVENGGWRFHDWKVYRPKEEQTLSREESASIAGKASAAARKLKHGTAQPTKHQRQPNEDRAFESRSTSDVRETLDRTETEPPEPPDPVPDPVPKDQTPVVPTDSFERRCKAWVANRYDAELRHGDPSLWPEVLEISADRDAAFGSPPVQLRRSDTRAYRVVERVAEGYTREQLREAFEGAALDDHIKSNAQFQGLGTLLRDAAQVDRFRALRASPPKPKTKGCAPLQPNAGKTGFESLEET